MGKDEGRLKLEAGLKEMDGGDSVLVLISSKELQSNINTALDHLIKRRGLNCVYFCINKPHVTIDDILRERGLNTSKVFFVDCSAALVTTRVPSPKRRVIYVSTPADLTGMGIAVKRVDPSFLRDGFILIDALRTLAIYNRPEVIQGFIKTLMSFATERGTRIIAFTTLHDALFERVSPLFKRIVELEYLPKTVTD